MYMVPRIETLSAKKLIGKRLTMSYSANKTFELWRSFLPHRKKIHNCVSSDLYSVQTYPPSFFDNFSPDTEFEKWAAVEVADFVDVPDDLLKFNLPGGLYAVFVYKGLPGAASKFFQYILGDWLPNSDYKPDDRPHFELLGAKYKNDDPDSEEEIWIPIKRK